MRWMVLVGLVLAGSAVAQDYRCMDDRGEYWSTTPCRPGEKHPGTRRSAPAQQPKAAPIDTDKHMSGAVSACGPAVQKLARVNYRWTARTPFGRWYLAHVQDVGDGTMMLGGDEIEFQNGFGNWIQHKYVCIYNPMTKKVVSASADPGRF